MFNLWRTVIACPVLALPVFALPFVVAATAGAQEMHDHPAPEKLGAVSFPVSCKAETQREFNRSVALLHSFAYTAAEQAFRGVTAQDPHCAMAHWGIAMTHFHQLWEPHLAPAAIPSGQQEMAEAARIGADTEREQKFIAALGLIFNDADAIAYSARAAKYEKAMGDLAAADQGDVEAQVFYALALISNASPSDKTHAKQKQAADLLEPLYRKYPDHPGIPHYLIHAYDNAELAPRGLAAARAYSKIAPSAPHALHMPSHIFTRLGLWDDSIASNLAAKNAAEKLGETGEELHAMDYLVYAYLQNGQDREAVQVIEQLKEMQTLKEGDFKIGYAATAMPVRYVVERRQWKEAASLAPPAEGMLPQVAAIQVWARGLGFARGGHGDEAGPEIEELRRMEDKLRSSGNDYWAAQVSTMTGEVLAWSAQAQGRHGEAAVLMRAAADQEDALEKLPVTPGPIVPAREQLGELLLEQGHPDLALKEFHTALTDAPGRRGALQGAAEAKRLSQQKQKP